MDNESTNNETDDEICGGCGRPGYDITGCADLRCPFSSGEDIEIPVRFKFRVGHGVDPEELARLIENIVENGTVAIAFAEGIAHSHLNGAVEYDGHGDVEADHIATLVS